MYIYPRRGEKREREDREGVVFVRIGSPAPDSEVLQLSLLRRGLAGCGDEMRMPGGFGVRIVRAWECESRVRLNAKIKTKTKEKTEAREEPISAEMEGIAGFKRVDEGRRGSQG